MQNPQMLSIIDRYSPSCDDSRTQALRFLWLCWCFQMKISLLFLTELGEGERKQKVVHKWIWPVRREQFQGLRRLKNGLANIICPCVQQGEARCLEISIRPCHTDIALQTVLFLTYFPWKNDTALVDCPFNGHSLSTWSVKVRAWWPESGMQGECDRKSQTYNLVGKNRHTHIDSNALLTSRDCSQNTLCSNPVITRMSQCACANQEGLAHCMPGLRGVCGWRSSWALMNKTTWD